MSEIRHDWLADRWVIFAPHRSSRPDEFVGIDTNLPTTKVQCPFCAGRESETPPAVLSYPAAPGDSQAERWEVRVVPNKFPAVRWPSNPEAFGLSYSISEAAPPTAPTGGSEADHLESDEGDHPRRKSFINPKYRTDPIHSHRTPHGDAFPNLFEAKPLVGAHEVIVESPEHLHSLTQVSLTHVRWVLDAYRERLLHWRNNENIQYGVIFKNSGADAGASLLHSHSQLICTSLVPPEVQRVCMRMGAYQRQTGQCVLCQTLKQEREQKVRVVWESDSFIAICPFASRLPYMVSLLPKNHTPAFEHTSQKELDELAPLLQRTLRSLEALHPAAAYNYVLHSSPFTQPVASVYHWRLEIFPRLTKVAGFEWGSDCFINPYLPEMAAEHLREHFSKLA